MQWRLVFKIVVLLTIANGLPIIGGKLFGTQFDQPVDRGVIFVDGRPVFGQSKTIRGVVLSLLATTASARVLGFAWVCGLVVASVSMSGDLISSFLKRRLSLPPSSRATGIDQIPESLLPTMASRSTIGLRGRFEIGCQACSSSSCAFASFRSIVSRPCVNQPNTGASSSRACCGFP